MIKIAICDDNLIQIDIIEKYIYNWSKQNKIEAKIEKFASGEAFLFSIEEEIDYDAIYLDIDMNKVSGIEVSNKIREKDKNVNIIFTTGMFKHVMHGYKVRALRYLLKPIKEVDLHESLDCILDSIGNAKLEMDVLTIETPKKIIKLKKSEIVYFEAFSPYIDVYTSNDKFKIRKKISDIEESLLDDKFVRCHRSYIVNLKYVKLIQRDFLTLDNDVNIPISRGKYKEINDKYLNYLL